MSPLGKLILRVMRAGILATAAFVVLVIAIEFWKYSQATAELPAQLNFRFLLVLVVMLGGALWLVRSISKEIRNNS